ncbi:hypothetical protein ACO22_07201 [Paracoccidioides brasiliensis]|uniref:Uncharacterized protein n=1 Tax=Paracoccidioides brasiliensis TaxID=121759 RepID=A0A1D2J5D9_PARBR|nr:hypothetical protein ACO22_07201 [Paracoccidioides brasiliensis]
METGIGTYPVNWVRRQLVELRLCSENTELLEDIHVKRTTRKTEEVVRAKRCRKRIEDNNEERWNCKLRAGGMKIVEMDKGGTLGDKEKRAEAGCLDDDDDDDDYDVEKSERECLG